MVEMARDSAREGEREKQRKKPREKERVDSIKLLLTEFWEPQVIMCNTRSFIAPNVKSTWRKKNA